MVPEKSVKSTHGASLWKRIRKSIPRKRHLRGGWLHRKLGDRIFAHELWHVTRRGVRCSSLKYYKKLHNSKETLECK